MASGKILLFFFMAAIVLFCYHFIFRPIILDCGAPEAVRSHRFAGDRFTGGFSHSRAVLIEATPEELWPWLIQIGQDRGGFYSYQWLENIFRADMKNVYEIKHEFQLPRQVGDTVWLANKNHYNGNGYQILAEITPYKSFVMVGGEDYQRILRGEKAMGSWAFYLHPETHHNTWLIARSSNGELSTVETILRYLFFELPHFIMERKMLITMKKLAEKYEP